MEVLWYMYNPLGPSGYCDEARAYLAALEAQGVDVALRGLSSTVPETALDLETKRTLKRLMGNQVSQEAACVFSVCPHHIDSIDLDRPTAVRSMFETDRIPERWVDSLNRVDRVWVPGPFNLETYERAGVLPEKLRVLPGILDEDFCRINNLVPYRLGTCKQFRFLTVISEISWRKGVDVLIESYVDAFSSGDDVCLVIKADQTGSAKGLRWVSELVAAASSRKGSGDTPEIELVTGDLDGKTLQALYRACHCFVLPSRGEGWARPVMEAMAMGLCCIVTGWGGHTAYVCGENAYLIDFDLEQVPEHAWREEPLFEGHRWAEPRVDHLQELMRHVVEHETEAFCKAEQARKDVLSAFSMEKVALTLGDLLEDIACSHADAAIDNPVPGLLGRMKRVLGNGKTRELDTAWIRSLKRPLRVALFGTGQASRLVSSQIEQEGVFEIAAYLDRDPDLAGRKFLRRRVLALNQLGTEDLDGIIIAVHPKLVDEIVSDLKQLDVAVPVWTLRSV